MLIKQHYDYLLFFARVGLSLSKKMCVICLIESLFKTMKNVFSF